LQLLLLLDLSNQIQSALVKNASVNVVVHAAQLKAVVQKMALAATFAPVAKIVEKLNVLATKRNIKNEKFC